MVIIPRLFGPWIHKDCLVLSTLFCFSYPLPSYARNPTPKDYGYDYAGTQQEYASQSQQVPKIEDQVYGSTTYDGVNGDGYDGSEEEEEIASDDLWTVISAFFDEKGLVNQQLSSFNEFVETTIAEVMEEHGQLSLNQLDQRSGNPLDKDVSAVPGLSTSSAAT